MNWKNLNKLIAPSALGITTFGYSMCSVLGMRAVSLFGGSTDNFKNAVVGSFMDVGLNIGVLLGATGFTALAGASASVIYCAYKLINGKDNITKDELKKSCIIAGTGALAAKFGAPWIVGMPLVAVAAIAGEAFVGK